MTGRTARLALALLAALLIGSAYAAWILPMASVHRQVGIPNDGRATVLVVAEDVPVAGGNRLPEVGPYPAM
jgi:hypothetical protein